MITTMSNLRANLGGLCKRVLSTQRPIRIRRRDGKEVVLVAAEQFDSMAETQHLLSSPENAARLLESLARARRGSEKPMTIEELRAAIGL